MAYRSISTVKADVARRWFQCDGDGIVWAVVDSGIDAAHPHFQKHANLGWLNGLEHRDFTMPSAGEQPLVDEFGHGTHIAAIIAGEMSSADGPLIAVEQLRDADVPAEARVKRPLSGISGMSPKATLLSLKVLGPDGSGRVSTVIQALAYIQEVNSYGRRIRIHGVNMSFGYDWDPKLFACGQSPLCIEVNRLVQTGVIVVAASGNTGYGYQQTMARGVTAQGFQLSINDPGNAELAITVGSTHRDQPAVYGVSYFSGKGPTLDGRLKPDLVAPGEYIVSAIPRATLIKRGVEISDGDRAAYYSEDSGTAMSAAHVSGVTAAFLSARRELIGNPAETKATLMATAVDLRRHRYFQGAGLVDLLRALFPAVAPLSSETEPGQVSVGEGRSRSASGAPPMTPTSITGAPVVPVPRQVQAAPPGQVPTAGLGRGLRLMISYAHKDEGLKDTLLTHLSALNRGRLLDVWQDRKILPGDEFGTEIRRQLDEADAIVLLISADFIASDYCYLIEMQRAIERHKQGSARVIPVVVRPADWEGTPMWGLNPLPKDGRAVTLWENTDEAWLNIAKGIRTAVQQMMSER